MTINQPKGVFAMASYRLAYRILCRPSGLSAILACSTILGFVAPSTAQPAPPAAQSDKLEEIVVTAARQGAQDVQKVPMAISVVSPAALDDLGMTGLEDYSRLVPGLSLQELSPGLNRVDIRGIVTTGIDPTNVQDRSLVAYYYDDTPITLNSANPDLKVFDLERIEVLKGPQGTLYGAGAMAGTIRLITKKPDPNAYSGYVETTVSDTAAGGGGINYTFRGMVNLPIAEDKAALRIVGYREYESGFIDNVTTQVVNYIGATQQIGLNQKGANDYDTDQARVALRLTPTDRLSIDASFTYDHAHGNGLNDGYTGLGDYKWSSLEKEVTSDDLKLYNVNVGYDLDFARITSSTAYLDRHIHSGLGDEYGPDAFLFGGVYPLQPASNQIHDRLHDIIEEARVTSIDPDSPLKWTAGVFYENLTRNNYQDQPYANLDSEEAYLYGLPGYSSTLDGAFHPNDDFSGYQNINENQLSIYAEATYKVLPDLDITAGLRYFDWRQKFGLYFGGPFGCSPCTSLSADGTLIPGTPLTQSGDAGAKGVNPRVAASYHVTDDVIVYAEAAKGFRYGGVNQPVPISICLPYLQQYGLNSAPISFGPDKLWQYTVGEKSTLLDRRLTLNADGFYINWNDVQTELGLNCSYYFVQNKGKITSKGLETEATARVTPALTVSVSAAYTEASADGNLVNIGALDGQRAPYFPRYQATLSATYVIPLENAQSVSITGNYSYKGNSYNNFNSQAFGFAELPSSTQLDFAVNYIMPDYEIGIYGTNVTDGNKVLEYFNNAYYGPGFTPGRYAIYARPRTFGLRAKASF
jgi:outer membrane receptor protein involved in Fe transport